MSMDTGFYVIIISSLLDGGRDNTLFQTKAATIRAAFTLRNLCLNDKCLVVIRPNFNEVDEHDRKLHREWRSIGGKPFREIRCYYELNDSEDILSENDMPNLPDVPYMQADEAGQVPVRKGFFQSIWDFILRRKG